MAVAETREKTLIGAKRVPWGTEYKFLNCYYIWLKQPPKLVSSLSKTIVHGPVGTGLVITSLVITTSKIQSQEKVEKWNT